MQTALRILPEMSIQKYTDLANKIETDSETELDDVSTTDSGGNLFNLQRTFIQNGVY